ncbi:MAG: hypothetical protein EOO12_00170 [Chitinophagaceae bacterium]|nr:MAG: hypothetical protein EOO12_00170 [Chitinophagaceae bacterium]
MTKSAVSDWSTTASSNTDVGGISLAEGVMLPSAVNNAFREIMAQIATAGFVGATTTVTLTNKTLTAPTINNPTLVLKQGSAPTPTAEGDMQWDTDDDVIVVGDGTSQKRFYAPISGTWTPAFSATGCTFSYATQYGGYRKVNDLVTIWGELVLNTSGNTIVANTLSITGLPFTPAASPTRIPLFSEWTLNPTNYVQLQARISGSSTTMAIVGNTAAGGNTGAQNANAVLSATLGSVFRFSGQYLV